MSYVEERVLTDELNSTTVLFKEKHAQILDEVKKIGDETKETRNNLELIHNRLDELETKQNRPKTKAFERNDERSAYTKAFLHLVCKEDDTLMKQLTPQEIKASFPNMNETILTQGGAMVPPEFERYVVRSLVQHSPMRENSTVLPMDGPLKFIPVQERAQNLQTGEPLPGLFQTAWGNEFGPIIQTATGLLKQKQLTACNLNALPFATQDFIDDSMLDAENYIMENLIESMAWAEGRAFCRGTGIEEPTGVLTETEGYGSVQAVGDANTIGTSGNLLIKVVDLLPPQYQRNAKFYLNQQTVRIIREWVDGQGQYLLTNEFGNTLTNGAPRSICGYPYEIMIDFPAPVVPGGTVYEAGSIPILFGNMKRNYYIGNPNTGLRMLRNPYTNIPYVTWWVRSRVAGNVILPETMVKVELAS